jgi:hypothetical protein
MIQPDKRAAGVPVPAGATRLSGRLVFGGAKTRRLSAEQAGALAEKLATGIWTHDYPIWASTAKSLGLSVSTKMPNDFLQLLTPYPQPARAQGGGVEYLPVQRRSPGGSNAGPAGSLRGEGHNEGLLPQIPNVDVR